MAEIINLIKETITNIVDKGFGSLFQGISILYIDIIEPLGHLAKERNDDFNEVI